MGYLSQQTEVIALPSDPRNAGWTPQQSPEPPGYWVRIKTRLTHGDRVAAAGALLRATVDLGVTRQNISGVLNVRADEAVLVARSIVAWNLDDEQGRILPISPETINLLDDQDVVAIRDRVLALNPVRSPEEQKNSSSPSTAS